MSFCLFRPFPCEPIASIIEPWGCSRGGQNEKNEIFNFPPKWHIPNQEELAFANELLDLHFQSALDDLLTICQTKMHNDAGKHNYKNKEKKFYVLCHALMIENNLHTSNNNFNVHNEHVLGGSH